jgi:hypothetical protein
MAVQSYGFIRPAAFSIDNRQCTPAIADKDLPAHRINADIVGVIAEPDLSGLLEVFSPE